MKKYTQRELCYEAFGDIMRGLGNVAKAGAKLAVPAGAELFKRARGIKDIYKAGKGEGFDLVIKDYLIKNRPVSIFKEVVEGGGVNNAVTFNEIVEGNAEYIFKDRIVKVPDPAGSGAKIDVIMKSNSIKDRLTFKKLEKARDLNDGFFEVPFIATSSRGDNRYIAYIEKINNTSQQVIGIKQASLPPAPPPAPPPATSP